MRFVASTCRVKHDDRPPYERVDPEKQQKFLKVKQEHKTIPELEALHKEIGSYKYYGGELFEIRIRRFLQDFVLLCRLTRTKVCSLRGRSRGKGG